MTPRLPLLSTALLAGMLLATSPAEARFGKRSSSSDSSKDDTKDSDSGQRTHEATPVGNSRPSPAPSRSSHEAVPVERPRYEPRRHDVYVPPPTYYVEPAPVYYGAPQASVAASGEEYASSLEKNFLLGFDMQVLPGGAAAGLHLGLELERWGGMLRASTLSLDADDGSGEQDSLSLFETHLSYAVLAGARGRLRVEGGLSVAKAPDVTFVGPMVGTSAEYYLLDSLAVEGRLQLTPVPYYQVDASGGLAWYVFGDLMALRGGMRMLLLNDAGKVDGVVHQDVLPGPYLSIGLAI